MKCFFLILAAIAFSFAATGQVVNVANPDAYQLRYAANVQTWDSYVNITNAGSFGGDFQKNGDLNANIYVIDPAQEVIACCCCPATPGHLKTLSVRNDLISNTLTPGVPSAVSVQIIASKGTCNAGTVTTANLVSGLRAWMTTPHTLVTAAGAAVSTTLTETEFSKADLDQDQFTKLVTYCSFIQANGSGFGICKSCKQGAQGPAKM